MPKCSDWLLWQQIPRSFTKEEEMANRTSKAMCNMCYLCQGMSLKPQAWRTHQHHQSPHKNHIPLSANRVKYLASDGKAKLKWIFVKSHWHPFAKKTFFWNIITKCETAVLEACGFVSIVLLGWYCWGTGIQGHKNLCQPDKIHLLYFYSILVT